MDWLPAAFNQGWVYRDRIGPADAGRTALAFYVDHYRHSDPSTWRQRLQEGQIARAGVPLRGDEPLACGDRLSWRRPPWREEAVPTLGPCLLDDGDLVVLDKPAGLPVLPAGGWLEHTVLRLLERRFQGDPAGVPRPVHRLGRFTCGLLVCARRPATRAWLSAALRESTAAEPEAGPQGPAEADAVPHAAAGVLVPAPADHPAGRDPCDHRHGPRRGQSSTTPRSGLRGHQARGAARGDGDIAGSPPRLAAGCGGPSLRKLYRALVVPGVLALRPGASLAITTPIGRRPHPQLGWIWCAATVPQPGDLRAHSLLTLLEQRPQGDLVQVAISSGRPHQIRIHCASVGAPLLGDPLYRPGGDANPEARPGAGGYRLQAWRLELRRPDGEPLIVQVPEALTN